MDQWSEQTDWWVGEESKLLGRRWGEEQPGSQQWPTASCSWSSFEPGEDIQVTICLSLRALAIQAEFPLSYGARRLIKDSAGLPPTPGPEQVSFRSMAAGLARHVESRVQQLQGPSGGIVGSKGQAAVDQVLRLLRVTLDGAEKRSVVRYLAIPGK